MSERKVLTKYYPPDFDPSAITRTRKPKDLVAKLPTVRLMAPFSMKCTTCGEYIYKGRKFNARKEITDDKYMNISRIRLYIRCTRCSAEITFKTDPRHGDYECERGALRNFEPWRAAKLAEETEEEMLDRLEREEAEHDPMEELEVKAMDAQRDLKEGEMLDEIRMKNARWERAGKEVDVVVAEKDLKKEERERQEMEDAEAARLAFTAGTGDKVRRLQEEEPDDDATTADVPLKNVANSPESSWVRTKKRKADPAAALGIRKKEKLLALPTPQPVGLVSYGSAYDD